jgi:4'-phosphopantetheinyl transferase
VEQLITAPPDHWPVARAAPALGPGVVHVWRVALAGAPADELAAAWASLSPDERARAERFQFERHRAQFVLARGALRDLLGRYLDTPPAALRFRYGPQGKPDLAWPAGELRFNLSHSHELALIALARGAELGVDVEQQAPMRDEAAVARQVFADEELAALAALPPDQRSAGFFNAWTRKEALIKARGEGLSLPLREFAVSLAPGEPARLLRSPTPTDLETWALVALDPGPGYAAALACAGPAPQLMTFQYCRAELRPARL